MMRFGEGGRVPRTAKGPGRRVGAYFASIDKVEDGKPKLGDDPGVDRIAGSLGGSAATRG